MKLDIGCGTHKQPGFTGMDSIAFEGVDVVHDVRAVPWPFADGSVSEVYSAHFVEHLTGVERIAFFNELHRIMARGAEATIVCPHWSHERAYGDPTHQWPPVTTWTFFYLNAGWRRENAPHVAYTCDFDLINVSGQYDLSDAWVAQRSLEEKAVVMQRNINCATDITARLKRR
jgi:hypothetical protein